MIAEKHERSAATFGLRHLSPLRAAYDANAMSGTTLVVAGGPQMDPLPAAFLAFDRCIAADSGADLCVAHGLRVDHLVGDLDSISAQTLARLEAQGVPIERHRVDKDKTDLELALDLALKANPERLLVAGIGGGRLDHFLANITTIASAAAPGRPVEAVVGEDHVLAFCDRAELAGRIGQPISLLPVLGTVEAIVTAGLHYQLEGEALVAGSSRGMSNRFASQTATIELGSGVLLAVWSRPGPENTVNTVNDTENTEDPGGAAS